MEFDDGEMIVVRHEYDEVWTDGKGVTYTERQSDGYYAIRDPKCYDLSDEEVNSWNQRDMYKIPGDIYISTTEDLTAYRKLLDAIEARIIERKAENDGV